MVVKDEAGKKYGFWTVIRQSDQKDKKGLILWECLCDCGTRRLVSGRFLRDGQSKSCGCRKTKKHRSIKLFNKKIEKLGDCWIWKGSVSKDGYGQFHAHGEYSAHRFSYYWYKGKIQEGMNVCHSCDNPLCVNPDHLFLGTQKDNIRDCVRKNRNVKGEKCGRSKLKEDDVRKIFIMYDEGMNFKEIAKAFPVSNNAINCVVRRRTWKHVQI